MIPDLAKESISVDKLLLPLPEFSGCAAVEAINGAQWQGWPHINKSDQYFHEEVSEERHSTLNF
jgi:hypothetical protein